MSKSKEKKQVESLNENENLNENVNTNENENIVTQEDKKEKKKKGKAEMFKKLVDFLGVDEKQLKLYMSVNNIKNLNRKIIDDISVITLNANDKNDTASQKSYTWINNKNKFRTIAYNKQTLVSKKEIEMFRKQIVHKAGSENGSISNIRVERRFAVSIVKDGSKFKE